MRRGCGLGEVVDEERACGAAVVTPRDGSVSLLSRRVPNLELDPLPADADHLASKLHAYRVARALLNCHDTKQTRPHPHATERIRQRRKKNTKRRRRCRPDDHGEETERSKVTAKQTEPGRESARERERRELQTEREREREMWRHVPRARVELRGEGCQQGREVSCPRVDCMGGVCRDGRRGGPAPRVPSAVEEVWTNAQA